MMALAALSLIERLISARCDVTAASWRTSSHRAVVWRALCSSRRTPSLPFCQNCEKELSAKSGLHCGDGGSQGNLK
jgi:hypothetical protein